MSAQQFRAHQSVRIKAGAMAGAVGTVLESKTTATGERVRVLVQGVHNGQAVDKVQSYAARQLEVLA